MKKLLKVLIFAVIIASFCTVLSSAKNGKYVYDYIDLLSDEEEAELEKLASDASEKCDAVFYFVVLRENYYEGVDFIYDEDIHDKNIVLIVVNDVEFYTSRVNPEYRYDIYTYGDAGMRITDTEINRIVYSDEVYDNIKSGKIFEGGKGFISLSLKAYKGHLPASILKIVIISLIIGCIVAVIVCVSVNSKYKRKLKSVKYPLDKYAKLNLREKNDIFKGSHVTRVRVDSSSGRGGSHGGSGHGGGAGHRGGA